MIISSKKFWSHRGFKIKLMNNWKNDFTIGVRNHTN